MTILDQIARYAEERVAREKEIVSFEEARRLAEEGGLADGERFYEAVAGSEMSFICEVKKASPSKGIIDPVFD